MIILGRIKFFVGSKMKNIFYHKVGILVRYFQIELGIIEKKNFKMTVWMRPKVTIFRLFLYLPAFKMITKKRCNKISYHRQIRTNFTIYLIYFRRYKVRNLQYANASRTWPCYFVYIFGFGGLVQELFGQSLTFSI